MYLFEVPVVCALKEYFHSYYYLACKIQWKCDSTTERATQIGSCLHFSFLWCWYIRWNWMKSGAYLIRSTEWALLLVFPRLHFSALEVTTAVVPGIDRSATASSCFELMPLVVDWVADDTKVPPAPPPPTGCWYNKSDDWQFCTGVIRLVFDGKLIIVFSPKTAPPSNYNVTAGKFEVLRIWTSLHLLASMVWA